MASYKKKKLWKSNSLFKMEFLFPILTEVSYSSQHECIIFVSFSFSKIIFVVLAVILINFCQYFSFPLKLVPHLPLPDICSYSAVAATVATSNAGWTLTKYPDLYWYIKDWQQLSGLADRDVNPLLFDHSTGHVRDWTGTFFMPRKCSVAEPHHPSLGLTHSFLLYFHLTGISQADGGTSSY